MAREQVDVESLVPHRGPSRLLEAVEDALEGRVVCRARIAPTSPFAIEGSAAAFVGLEIAAQAAAAAEALARLNDEGAVQPRVGYLVGVRDAIFHVVELPLDRPLRVCVQLASQTGSLKIYDALVTLEGAPCMQGKISTTIP